MSFLRPEESASGPRQFKAIFRNMLGKAHTLNLVEVVGVKASGVEEVGTVDIRPMTLMIDAENTVIERGTIYNVPFFRLQSGSNAVIVDPKVGDIGLGLFCERDISTVVRTKAKSAPSTKRQFDLNDAVYLGSYLSSAPSQYIYFKDSGMDIKTTGDVNINGLKIGADGKLTLANGVVVDSHTHGNVQNGNGNTGGPK